GSTCRPSWCPVRAAAEPAIGETAPVTSSSNGGERPGSRAWADEGVRRIDADASRSTDTHLHAFPLPEAWGIDMYLKHESVHPAGWPTRRTPRLLLPHG